MNIHVYLIPVNNIAIVEHVEEIVAGEGGIVLHRELTRGYAFPDDRVVFMPVAHDIFDLGPSPLQVGRIIGRTTHEIGHILVGSGHPDQYSDPDYTNRDVVGVAPLPGTDTHKRLMHSGVGLLEQNLDEFGKQLVKKEWDEAEEWMDEEEQRANP